MKAMQSVQSSLQSSSSAYSLFSGGRIVKGGSKVYVLEEQT
jgi:hypothetical protein